MLARRIGAASVHVFTALGIVCALLALLAVIDGRYDRMFLWLGIAFLIDGIDGTFARLADVETWAPRISGERLDLVIDYVTYVFVPAVAMMKAGFLPGTLGMVLASGILLSSLYHFSDLGNKSDDNCFVGFPAIWNIVAFYVFAFGLSPLVTGVLTAACVVLTFVPFRWVHPLRVEQFFPLTLAMTLAWALAAVWALWGGLPTSGLAQIVLAVVAVYGVALSLYWRWVPSAGG